MPLRPVSEKLRASRNCSAGFHYFRLREGGGGRGREGERERGREGGLCNRLDQAYRSTLRSLHADLVIISAEGGSIRGRCPGLTLSPPDTYLAPAP